MFILRRTIATSIVLVSVLTCGAAFAQAPGACTPNYTYAQMLIDETLARHPELTALVIHAVPPGSKENMVIASNIWLTGTKSDEDDIGVFHSGKTMTEMNKAGTKYEVQGVLKNVLGAPIGSVATVFPYKAGVDKTALEEKAAAIRAELGRRILNPTNMVEAFPYDPQIAWHTYAQQLMKQELAKNPDLLVFALHAVPPNRKEEVILGSNIGRIGKPDDIKDIEVLKSGKPSADLRAADQRAQVVLPLKDAHGRMIGVLNLLLHNGQNKDSAGMIARAEAIRDETGAGIPDVTALFEPARD